MPAVPLQKRARDAGITTATLRRAKSRLEVMTNRDGFGMGSAWVWRLQPGPSRRCSPNTEGAQVAQSPEDEHLRDSMSTLADVADKEAGLVSAARLADWRALTLPDRAAWRAAVESDARRVPNGQALDGDLESDLALLRLVTAEDV